MSDGWIRPTFERYAVALVQVGTQWREFVSTGMCN